VRFLSRVKMNMREISNLKQAIEVNQKIAEDQSKSGEDRAEAEQRIAEINLRLSILRLENNKL